MCRYPTDVAEYTLLVSFTEIIDWIFGEGGRPEWPISAARHPTHVAPVSSAPYNRRTRHFSKSLAW
ncbi:hypothetical protein ABIE53_000154 [Burkholderia sp. OAS925]